MPRFLNTTGNAVLSVFICSRCRMKRPSIEAMPDANFPGLVVCQQGCADQKDPYRLPARKTERINLQYPRPDVSVAVEPYDIVTQPYGGEVLSTQQSTSTPSDSGNIDILKTQPSP